MDPTEMSNDNLTATFAEKSDVDVKHIDGEKQSL